MGDGAGRKAGRDGIDVPARRRATGEGWAWWHLDRTHPEAPRWLAAHGVPDQAIEALLDAEVRPRLTRAPGGLVLILRADRGEGDHEISRRESQLISVRLWVDARGLVSASRHSSPALEALAAALPAAPGTLLADLIEHVVDSVTPRADALVRETEALEDRVIGMGAGGMGKGDPVDGGTADRLATLRRRVVRLSRALDAQRDALAALARLAERDGGPPDGPAMNAATLLDLNESVEQCRHDASEVDGVRERALILRDELERRADERTARHAFVLSVAAAVFLPATFVTGLLGMNVSGLPGADAPLAFWWVVALCAGIGAASFAFVLWRRWL